MTIPTIPKGKLVENRAEADKIHPRDAERVKADGKLPLQYKWWLTSANTSLKTNMTLDNPHFQYESTSPNGGFSIAMSVFF